MFHQDNARPRTLLITGQKLRELKWEALSHPLHSPDILPSDHHLFLSMANALGGVKLAAKEARKKWPFEFCTNKGGFLQGGITTLLSI